MSTNDLQTDVNAAIDAVVPAKVSRPNLSPELWEALAKYVENKYRVAEMRALQGEQLLKQGMGGSGLQGQVIFWRATAAVAKKLAYDFRVGRDGPWNIKSSKKSGNKPS